MLRRIFSPQITVAVSNLCRTSVPVRRYPRRSLPLPPEVTDTDYNTVDAFDESEITSQLENMEDEIHFENHKIEKEKQRQWLKKKILQRKHFKEPQALNLLSWAAKEQIRYLNAEYPEDWTVQKLAQSFPVSEKGIIKILKSDIIVYSQKDKDKHDQRVRKNWKQIQQHLKEGVVTLPDGGPIAETVKCLAETNKLTLMINAGGMDNINVPPRKETTRRKIGMFEALVKDYVEGNETMEKDTVNLNSKELLSNISNFQASKRKERSDSEEYDVEDVKFKMQPENLHSRKQYSRHQKRLLQNVENQGSLRLEDSQLDNLALNGTGRIKESSQTKTEPMHSERLRYQKQREQREVWSKIKFESGREEMEGAEGYTYDTVSGYQYPLGKMDHNLKKLDVPKLRNKKGDMYIQGKYVYDEDGEFLYKIP